jgi:MoaA/NifB/PqqE/SkfB family radical SAM enzyme
MSTSLPNSTVDRVASPGLPTLRSDYSCDFPENYLVEPGNICHLKCRFCHNGMPPKDTALEKGFLSPDTYGVILDKISPYAKMVMLYNWGEPFLNKDMLRLIRMTAARRIQTNISSNLSIAGLDLEGIVTSGLDWLVASIDGATQSVYEKYRVGGNIELVLENIRGIEAIKKRLGVKTPVVSWQFLVCRHNEHERDAATKLAAELGIGISFQLMSVLDSSWRTTLTDDALVPAYMKRTTHDEYGRSNRELPVPVRDILLHPEVSRVCKQVFDLMVIHWNGDVYPCCATHAKDSRLGNLLAQSLEDVWNGKSFRDYRKALYHCRPNPGRVQDVLKCDVYGLLRDLGQA